jgi:hypothetical protein
MFSLSFRLLAIPDGTPDSYGAPGKKAVVAPAKKGGAKEANKAFKKAPSKEKSPPAVAGPCPPVPAETGGWNAKALQLFDDIAAQGEKVKFYVKLPCHKLVVKCKRKRKNNSCAQTSNFFRENTSSLIRTKLESGGRNAKALQLFDDIAAQGEKVNLI